MFASALVVEAHVYSDTIYSDTTSGAIVYSGRATIYTSPVQLQWRWGGAYTRGPTAESMRLASAVSPFHATGRPQCPQWGGSSGCHGSGSSEAPFRDAFPLQCAEQRVECTCPAVSSQGGKGKKSPKESRVRAARGDGASRARPPTKQRGRAYKHTRRPPKPPLPQRHSIGRLAPAPKGTAAARSAMDRERHLMSGLSHSPG